MHFAFFLAAIGTTTLLLPKETSSQIPTVCSDAKSMQNKICCPMTSVDRVPIAASVLRCLRPVTATIQRMYVQTGRTISLVLVSATATLEDMIAAGVSLATMEKNASSFKCFRDAPSTSTQMKTGMSLTKSYS